MSKSAPTIQKFMTYQPHTVDADETITNAISIMSKENIRHLPVMKNGQLSGIISDRDIKLSTSIADVEISEMIVDDIASTNPYSVDPDTPLDNVASEMADKHFGSAIVVQNNKVVGIFTTVDACRALSDVLLVRHH